MAPVNNKKKPVQSSKEISLSSLFDSRTMLLKIGRDFGIAAAAMTAPTVYAATNAAEHGSIGGAVFAVVLGTLAVGTVSTLCRYKFGCLGYAIDRFIELGDDTQSWRGSHKVRKTLAGIAGGVGGLLTYMPMVAISVGVASGNATMSVGHVVVGDALQPRMEQLATVQKPQGPAFRVS